MAAPTDLEFLARVLLATGCGALIGLERQYRSRTAGLRTRALVAAGAATFVLFGEQVGSTTAPLQITAYVASGVGFLGGVVATNRILTKALGLRRTPREYLATALFFLVVAVLAWALRRMQARKLI